MAAGTPVIVPNRGGAAESAQLLEGGVVLPSFHEEDWRWALDKTQTIKRASLAVRTRDLSTSNFQNRITAWIGSND